jgi:hypothetical protein
MHFGSKICTITYGNKINHVEENNYKQKKG